MSMIHFPISNGRGGEVWVTMNNEDPHFLEKLEELTAKIRAGRKSTQGEQKADTGNK